MNNRIGVMINYDYGTDLNEKFKKNIELDIYSCQLCIWNVDIFKDKEQIDHISNAIKSTSSFLFKKTPLYQSTIDKS